MKSLRRLMLISNCISLICNFLTTRNLIKFLPLNCKTYINRTNVFNLITVHKFKLMIWTMRRSLFRHSTNIISTTIYPDRVTAAIILIWMIAILYLTWIHRNTTEVQKLKIQTKKSIQQGNLQKLISKTL